MKRQSNTSAANAKRFYDRDTERRILRRLPKKIRNFVLYDAIGDMSLRNVEKHIKMHGAEDLWRIIVEFSRNATIEAYGKDHPQAKRQE